MRGSFKIFTIKGISVYLHYTFLIFVAWLLFLYIITGMQWVQLLWSFLFLIAVFSSVIVHEYGHALVAAKFGINAKKITLYPIGGIASIEKLPENPKQELWISGAGPVVSICLAALLLLFAPQKFSIQSFNEMSGELNQENFVYMLGLINLLLAAFNMIPAFPLDGGRVLRALLALKFNYLKATTIAALIGRTIAFIIIIVAVLNMNFILALIGAFIIIFSRVEESNLQLKTLVQGVQLKDVLMYDYHTIDAHLNVHDAANSIAGNDSKYFIITDNGLPKGILKRVEILKAAAENDYDTKVFELIKDDMEEFDADTPVEDVLGKFSGIEDKIYLVFDKGKLKGVVSFNNIIEHLMLLRSSTLEKISSKSKVFV
jgi:Zn-dependent protease